MIIVRCCHRRFRLDESAPNGPAFWQDGQGFTRQVSHCPTCGSRLIESSRPE